MADSTKFKGPGSARRENEDNEEPAAPILDSKPRGLWQQLDGRAPEPKANRPRGMWEWINARAQDQRDSSTQASAVHDVGQSAMRAQTFDNTGSVFAKKETPTSNASATTSSAPEKQIPSSAIAPDLQDRLKRAESSYDVASTAANTAINSLVPAYRAARDRVDVGVVAEIGGRLLGAYDVIHGASSALGHLLRSLPHQETKGSNADEMLDVARRQGGLEQRAGSLDAMVALADRAIASALTPHVFNGMEVAGEPITPVPHANVDEENARLAGELHRTIGMLTLVVDLQAKIGAGRSATQATLDGARLRIGPWSHRPLDLAFLRAALGPIWAVLDSGTTGPGLEKPSAMLSSAAQQAKRTGWLGDVGTFDINNALTMLRTGGRGMAELVIGNIKTADRDTRGHLLSQIKEQGLLDNLCSAVGWAAVKDLHDNLGDGFSELKHDLQRYFIGKGKYGPSLTSEWEDHDSSVHSEIEKLGGVGKVLNFVIDLGTFGFSSSYAEARDSRTEGDASESEAFHAEVHAGVRAAAAAIVATVTGGMAQRLVGGAAGASTARVVAGDAAGGAVGAVTGLGASDAYNMYIAGTQTEPSAPQRYVEAALMGGAGGAALGKVARGMSRKASAYLPSETVAKPAETAPPTESHVSPYRTSNPKLDAALTEAKINASDLTSNQQTLIESADRSIADGDIHGSIKTFDQLVESGIPKPTVEALERSIARAHGKTSPTTYRDPKATLPNGSKAEPSSYGGELFYGTSEILPSVAFERGLPARGNNTNLLQHVEQSPDTAFRGTTKWIFDPGTGGQSGAGHWAGEGGWVYKLDGTPSWDVNATLAGRVPKPDGSFGDAPMPVEHEHSTLANIPPERIVGAQQILERNGRLVPGPFQANPNYRAPK